MHFILLFLIFFNILYSDFKVHKGLIDLTGFDFNNRIIKLDGEWEFYHKKFKNEINDSKPNYLLVPKSWDSQEIDNKKIPSFSYGTYRLRIIGLKKYENYSLKIKEIRNSYNLYIDNRFILSDGKPSSNANEAIEGLSPQIADFTAINDITELIIEVSDWTTKGSGIYTSIELGLTKNIYKQRIEALIISSLAAGGTLFLFAYNLALFLFRKKDKSSLTFSMVSLNMLLYSIVNNEKIFNFIFPQMFNEISVRLAFLSAYLTPITIFLFIYSLFYTLISKKILILNLALFCPLVITIFMPFKITMMAELYIYFQIALIIFFIIMLKNLIPIIKTKKYFESNIVFWGLIIYFIFGFTDVIVYTYTFKLFYLNYLGIFIYLISQLLALSVKINRGLDEAESKTYELSKISQNLNNILEKIRNSMLSIFKIIKDLNTSSGNAEGTANQLATAVNEMVKTMENVFTNSNNTLTIIKEMNTISAKTKEDINHGFEKIKENINQMKEIKNQNNRTLQGIKSLNEKINNIWEIVKIINNIADQTKVIAFNAQIEAAAAGNTGKNFQIVANEIKRLADDIVISTKEIKNQINEIQKSSDDLIFISEEETRSILEGWNNLNNLNKIFETIHSNSEINLTASEKTSETIKTSISSFEQILLTLKQISEGINNFAEIVKKNANLAKELEETANKLEAINQNQ